VGLYTELFYAIVPTLFLGFLLIWVVYWTVLCYHPYLVSMLFADLLSLHLVLTGFLCCIGWRITGFLQTLSTHQQYF